MSLFNYQPPEISPPDEAAMEVKKRTSLMFSNLVQSYKATFNYVWRNELPPQEIFDSLGPDSVQLFQLSAALAEFLNTIEPNTITAEDLDHGYDVVYHQDGTVTVTKQGSPPAP